MESILSNEDILRRVSFAPAFMPIPTVEAITDLTNDTDRALRELGYMTIDRRILLLDRQRACYLLGVQRGMEKYRNALLQQQGNALQPDMPFHLDRDESTGFINADEYLSAGENLLSTNVFAYCYCDPINLKDPNGNIAEAALIFTDLSAELIASIAAALGVTVIWVVGIILIVGVAELYSYVVRQADDSSFKDKTLSDVRPHIPDRSKVYQIAYINEQGSLIRLSTYYSYFEALAMLNCLGVYNNLRTPVDYNSSSYCAAHKKVNELGYSVWGIYTHYQVHAKALAVSIGVVTPPKVHGSGKYGHYNDSGHSLHIWFGGILNY